MRFYKFIAEKWLAMFLHDDFLHFQDKWISDEIMYQTMKRHMPNLDDMLNTEITRSTMNLALGRNYSLSVSLDSDCGIFRQWLTMECPISSRRRKIWFYLVSKETKSTRLPTDDQLKSAFKAPERRKSPRSVASNNHNINCPPSQRPRVQDCNENGAKISDSTSRLPKSTILAQEIEVRQSQESVLC